MQELTIRLATLPKDLPQIHKIRYLVFQIEQGVDPTLEFDGKDDESEHMLVYQGEKAVGTVRMRWLDASTVKIERFAVLHEFRGRGIGHALMEAVLSWLVEKQITTVCMNAQQPAQAFYQRFGFAPEGQVFEEAGIPHIRMKKLLR